MYDRYERWAGYQQEIEAEALAEVDVQIGDKVWYRNKGCGGDRWVEAEVIGAGSKDRYPVVDVKLTDSRLPGYQGMTKWGYGWAVKPWTPAPPNS